MRYLVPTVHVVLELFSSMTSFSKLSVPMFIMAICGVVLTMRVIVPVPM